MKEMNQYKIDLNSIPWETPANGIRYKALLKNGKKLRIIEFTKEFIEPDWCKKSHTGYVLDGKLEINFDGDIIVYTSGDALFIPEGDKHKHIAKAITATVRIFLVEDA